MSFLVDENLSRHLCRLLAPAFPGSRHVAEFGLLSSDDEVIHARARAEGLALLSKDDDFRAIVDRLGPPPKLVFVRLGNATTRTIAAALIGRKEDIEGFLSAPPLGVLENYLRDFSSSFDAAMG